MDTMNEDVMACHEILKPEQPTHLTAGTPVWVKNLLQSAGWQDGDPVPSGLNEYFPRVIQLLGMPVTPASAREIIKRDDVLLTLRSKLATTHQIAHQEELVKERTESLLGKPENYNPGIFDTLKKVAQEVSEKEVKEEIQEHLDDNLGASTEEADLPLKDEPTEEKKPMYVVACPRCALSLMDKYEPIETTEQDKEDYLFHVLGSKRYYKTFPIFNGLGKITLQTPTAEEFDRIRIATLTWEAAHRDLPAGIVSDRYFATYLPFAVASIKITKELPIIPYTDQQFKRDNLVDSMQAYMDYWYSNVVVSSELRNELVSLVNQFMMHVTGLREELYNRDFWGGVVVR